MTDQFATVTVVPNEEIRRSAPRRSATSCFPSRALPAPSFAPGASSRPIIRGLDVNRVGIVENGIGSNGASDLGEDHFVPIDPLSTNQVEVIRGPATLRYGSNAIGGVVSATNNRIPDALPSCAAAPFQSYGLPAKAPLANVQSPSCVTAKHERRSAGRPRRRRRHPARCRRGQFRRACRRLWPQGQRLQYSELSVSVRPDPARQRPPAEFGRAGGRRLDRRLVYLRRRLYRCRDHAERLAVSYPGIDGADHQTRIDAHQTKVTTKGEYRPDAAAIEAIRFWAGATDYKHNEIGLADPRRSQDARRAADLHQQGAGRPRRDAADAVQRPLCDRDISIRPAGEPPGTDRAKPGRSDLSINGLFDPNRNNKVAGYGFNELKFTETTKAQISGRLEHVNLTGTTPAFIPERSTSTSSADSPTEARNLSFTPKSASIGLIQILPAVLVASITGQYVERAPKPAELFSRGPHDATATFDIGNPNLASKPPNPSRSHCGGQPDRCGSKQPPTTCSSTASSTGA